MFTGLECFLREIDKFLVVWRNTQKTLLVIAADTTQSQRGQGMEVQYERDLDVVDEICKDLQQDTNKGVVFISTSENVLVRRFEDKLGDKFKQVKDNFQLCQLTTESLEYALETKVLFQGQQVEKKYLIGDIGLQGLEQQIIDFVVKPVTETLGQPFGSTSASFFIPRTMYRRNYVKKTIFKSQNLSGKYAISGITDSELQKLVPSDKVWMTTKQIGVLPSQKNPFLILSLDNAESHFNHLCKELPLVHWLHMEDKELMWKRSHGSINEVLEYIDEDQCSSFNPKTLLDISDRVVVIIAEPGMGKTTLLSHIAQQTKNKNPSDWVVSIELNDYSDLLDITYCQHFQADKFFSHVADMNKISSLEKALLQHNLMKNDNVIVVLDGVDELSESCIENFKLFMKHLLNTRVKKIWVTSRHSRDQLLERLLTTIAFSLKMFTTDDQKSFLKEFWKNVKTTMMKPQQEDFINKIITFVHSSLGDREQKFAGIPLQTKMVAEVFQNNFTSPSITKISEKLDLLTLYEMFVDKKYLVAFEEKHNCSVSKMQYVYQSYRAFSKRAHIAAALVLLLDDKGLKSLSDKNIESDYDKFILDVKKGFEKTGIVDREINGKPHFIHKTFAEYYAGTWLAENYQKNKTLLSTHFCCEEFRVVRNIFDRTLSRKNALHTAVSNGDTSQIESLLESGNDVNSLDTSGRTALHLAAAVGFNNSAESEVNLSVMNILLDHGADLTREDLYVLQWTPLRYADATKAYDVIDLILKNNKTANINDIKQTTEIIEDQANLNVVMKHGFLQLFEFLLDNGLDVNAKFDDARNSSLLHISTKYSKENLSRLLILKGADIMSLDMKNNTPLHTSAQHGQLCVAQSLLQLISEDEELVKQCVNARDVNGNTAMHFAALNGHVDVMRLLASVGGDLQSRGEASCTLLHYAAVYGPLTVTQFLLEAISEDKDVVIKYVNARDDDGNTAMHFAACSGHVDAMRLLINAGGDLQSRGFNDRTILHNASHYGHVTVVQFLLEVISDDKHKVKRYVNARDVDENTAMHLAALNGHVDVMRRLASVGGDLLSHGFHKRTILHNAAHHGHLPVVQFLLEVMSDDTDEVKRYVYARNDDENTAMHLSVVKGHVDMMRLLASVGGDLQSLGFHKRTILHYTAHFGHLAVAQFLLEVISHDKDEVKQYVNARDNYGNTAMHFAAREGHVDVAQLFITAGGDVRMLDKHNSTSLTLAAEFGHFDVVELILNTLGDETNPSVDFLNVCDNDGESAVFNASGHGHFQIVKCLADKGADVTLPNRKRKTALHIASKEGHLSVVEVLIDSFGCDTGPVAAFLDARDLFDFNALSYAVTKGHAEIVRLLISNGCDVTSKHSDLHTPLHRAAISGHLLVVQLLVGSIDNKDKVAAFINRCDSDGKTAINYSRNQGHEAVAKWLEETLSR